ncbi:hypothetical protein [Halorussus sp. MSC15.2]|uniref:hypothetical protein n=1 Tax=Halorussus sp. MSC15.2 TaxID=2283638 RepID=UPI0013D19DB6|nr:hypothetical protein [Halorussus sp. MSC15.2]NEU57159.1 hypothetical protein [Halorussus sp. MSC15.2]
MALDALRSRGLSVGRSSVAVVLLALLVAAARGGNLRPSSLVLLATGVVFFVASAFRRVRNHAAWNVTENAVLLVWGLALYLGDSDPVGLALLLVAGGLLGVVVESYNYRHGTTYGRITWRE